MTLDDLDRIGERLESMRGTERMRTELDEVARALDRYPAQIESWGELWVSQSFPWLEELPIQFSMENLSGAYVTRIVSVLQGEDLVQWERHLRGRALLDETGNGGNGEE